MAVERYSHRRVYRRIDEPEEMLLSFREGRPQVFASGLRNIHVRAVDEDVRWIWGWYTSTIV